MKFGMSCTLSFNSDVNNVSVRSRACFVCIRAALDHCNGKLFTLLCTKFPLRPHSFLSENDSGPVRVCVCVCVVITCDITTLISSLVIVKSLWIGRLNNEKEWEMRVCMCYCLKGTVDVCVYSSLLLDKFSDCNFCMQMHLT